MKEVYIIEKNGNIVYYKIPNSDITNFDKEDHCHEYYYKKYIKDKNIELIDDKLTSYQLAEELSKIGISSIIVENKKMFIFLPEYITKDQFNWFINSKNALNHFEISFGYIKNDKITTIDPDNDENEITKIKDFYKHIKNNILQKEGEIDEHRRVI